MMEERLNVDEEDSSAGRVGTRLRVRWAIISMHDSVQTPWFIYLFISPNALISCNNLVSASLSSTLQLRGDPHNFQRTSFPSHARARILWATVIFALWGMVSLDPSADPLQLIE
jgi:hypothetical protein